MFDDGLRGSPYVLNRKANHYIGILSVRFSREIEETAIKCLNLAETHPKMSLYQLSLTHRALGDLYYQYGFAGSALIQYQRGLEQNPSLSVRRRIKEITALPSEQFTYSASPDLFPSDIKQSAGRKTIVCDPEFEKDLTQRVSALNEDAQAAFWSAREQMYLQGREDVLTYGN